MFAKNERACVINQRWCIASTLIQALLMGFNNINERPDETFILESPTL
jgi:hypothetical protein